MATVSYDTELQMYRVFLRSGITQGHHDGARDKGWRLYVDGHSQIYGLLSAPAGVLAEVETLFRDAVSDDDKICFGCGEKFRNGERHDCSWP